MRQRKEGLVLLSLVFLTFFGMGLDVFGECRTSEIFPLYFCIQPNVTFWKKIYTEFDISQGVIHDNKNLGIIYEVIPLETEETGKARKTNRNRIDQVRKRYESILRRLSADPSNGEPEARRVAALFGKGAKAVDFKEAVERIRCQVGQKDRFRMGLIRSGAYMAEIRKIFVSHGLPEDLAYLPHVESSFNPRAYSRFGAAGIWQFTQSTGKRYMAVNYTIDERWDPICASHAAAQLLKSNYQSLGSWPLAITAYNHGLGGMLRAKKSKGDYEAVFKDYRGRLFKFASRNFYPEFLAAREVAKNPEKHFGKLELHKPIVNKEIELEGYVTFMDLVRHFGVDGDTLKQLNPALREPVFRGQKHLPKGYALRLPERSDSSIITALSIPSNIYKSNQKHSLIHLVREGDTVGEIAQIHGLQANHIILANNLNSSAVIYPGQNLRIPAIEKNPLEQAMVRTIREEQGVPTASISKEKMEADDVEESRVVLTRKEAPQKGPSSMMACHTKIKGIDPEAVTGNLLVRKIIEGKGRPIGIIRIGVEETLGHYAEWLGIQAREIRQLNGFNCDRLVRMNEQIKIPFSKRSKEEFEERRFEYHKKIQEDFFASYRVEEVKVYNIKQGDNLWRLCLETFEVPFWLLSKYNPKLEFNKLQPSQEIRFPVLEENG